MASFPLKYVVEDRDRHGNVRVYLRRPGKPKVRLHCSPDRPEFLDLYKRAMAGELDRPAMAAKGAPRPGSLRAICIGYYRSAEFKFLDPRTQRVRRSILDGLCQEYGSFPLVKMEPRHVRKLRDQRVDAPEAANARVKALRQVFKYAVDHDLAERNAAAEVSYLNSGSQGFHSWTLEEVQRYEKKHPIGTRARLALALLLYTGQRRSDVVLFGRQHVRQGWLHFTQQKNRNRKPIELDLPIIPDLQAIIDASPCGDLTFLVTEFGRPFSAAGFGNRFRKWCDEAGLLQCSAHGLRKATAARLAELGCSEHEIMAVTGHKTSKEIIRYTRAARQKDLAESAMKKLATGHTHGAHDADLQRVSIRGAPNQSAIREHLGTGQPSHSSRHTSGEPQGG
jgi:integrase